MSIRWPIFRAVFYLFIYLFIYLFFITTSSKRIYCTNDHRSYVLRKEKPHLFIKFRFQRDLIQKKSPAISVQCFIN